MNFQKLSLRQSASRRIFALFCGIVLVVGHSGAVWAEDRSDFLFSLQTALKTRDRDALRACFEFRGADSVTVDAIDSAINQMLSWPTHHLKVTERSNSGPIFMDRDGQKMTLNGDWKFQVHIHITKPPSRGFVLPGGITADGRNAILMTVPAP